jgi:cytoskeleton protein RodZ
MSKIVGQQLRQARLEQKIPLEQVSEETHIRLHYLEAIEKGDFDDLPSKAHARGFLRSYAGYMGMEPNGLLALLDGEAPQPQAVDVEPSLAQDDVVQISPLHSTVIFKELGENLKHQRELLGFSIEEVERSIHIRQHYLEALETGDLNGLPSPVQGRGMLQNYASFLGLDSDSVLLQFADGLQAQLAEKQASRSPSPTSESSRTGINLSLRRYFPGDLVLGALLLIGLIGFVVWGILRISSLNAPQTPSATVPSIAEALLMTPDVLGSEIPSPTVLPTAESPMTDLPPGIAENPTEQPPEEATPIPTVSDAPVQIYISVLQRAWMRLIVDGDIEFEGRVVPGGAYSFAGDFQIELLTGNGAALQVFFNETDLGVLGVYGEVIYRVFTPDGMVLPTSTITPTPTITPTSSQTTQPTETRQSP